MPDADLKARLEALPVPEMAPDLTQRIVSGLLAQPRPTPVVPLWTAVRRTALALAACVVLALAGLLATAWSGQAGPVPSAYSVRDYWGERMTQLLKDPLDVINAWVKGVKAG